MEKTKEQLEEQIRVDELLRLHRVESNLLYAPIIVKIIVFGLCALLLTAVVGALVKLIIINSVV
jgi:hypothetical protein